MAEQIHAQSQTTPTEQEEPQVLEATEAEVAPIDNILDQIDTILEENTQDFVNAFVQKGGQ